MQAEIDPDSESERKEKKGEVHSRSIHRVGKGCSSGQSTQKVPARLNLQSLQLKVIEWKVSGKTIVQDPHEL